MPDIDVRKLEQIIQKLGNHSDESRGFIIAIAAVVASIPGAEKVSAAAARRTAADLIGPFGASALSSSAAKMIDLICRSAKNAAEDRPNPSPKQPDGE